MTIHILNCLDIHPYFTWAKGGVTCLLIETNQGPVLVDAGIGLQDHKNPLRKMRLYQWFYRATTDTGQTAFHLVQQLGYKPEEVRHIILSHAHLDHAGGLRDFPHVSIHLLQREFDHIHNKPNWKYMPAHWTHRPDWQHHAPKGGKWFGLDAVRLERFVPEIWLLPLPGHTPGLAGVAVKDGSNWLLYGSDALPYNARIDLVPRWFARFFMYHHAPEIRALIAAHPEIQLVGGHMSQEFYASQNPFSG